MDRFTTAIRPGLLLFLAILLIPSIPASAAAQEQVVAGLKFDAAEVDARLKDELTRAVGQAVQDASARFIDFSTAHNKMNPVTRNCYTSDCLTKIGAALGAARGLSIEMSGEAEIYQWTAQLWDLQQGQMLASRSESCELCGNAEVARKFKTTLKTVLETSAPQAGGVVAGGASDAAADTYPVLHVAVLPEDAEIYINDQRIGEGTVTVRLAPGTHDVRVHMEGHRDVIERVLVNEDTRGPIVLRVHLTSTNPLLVEGAGREGPIDRLGSTRTILGWTGVGVGVLAIGTGIYLTAIDGDPACDASVPLLACPDVYATAGAGLTMGVLGAALLTGGVTLLSWDLLAGAPQKSSDAQAAPREQAPEARALRPAPTLSLSPTLGIDSAGVLLRGSF